MARKRICTRAIAVGLFILVSLWIRIQAQAQGFPTKPVQIVIPFAAGGITDLLGRLFSERSNEFLGQKMVLSNKPGAGGVLGFNAVVKSPPDGYTIGMCGGLANIHKALGTALPFDPVKDFTYISRVIYNPILILVKGDSPLSSIEKLVDYGKKNPGKLNYGTSGVGTALHLGGELFQLSAGIKMTHVPYKGSAPSAMALLGGHIDLTFSHPVDAMEHVKAGKLIPLAATSVERFPELPNVPTLTEKGFPTAVILNFIGVIGPAGIPKPVLDKLAGYFKKVEALPDVQKKLKEMYLVQGHLGPEDYRKFVMSDLEKMQDVVKKANVKIEQ